VSVFDVKAGFECPSRFVVVGIGWIEGGAPVSGAKYREVSRWQVKALIKDS
jgi:hypothetical protein